jgi:hypothetical protein
LEKYHFKDFQLRIENSEVQRCERIVTIDLKGTRVSGFSAPRKRKGISKGWKVDISEHRIPEGIVIVD